MQAAGILGTGSYLPEKVVTNQDLEQVVDTSDEWITTRTGIKERRQARPDQATSDLCLEAARQALADANTGPEEIDLVIVATVTPDMMFPATACLVQDRLRASGAAAFDLEAGCSGFMYGLALASQMIATGSLRKALVIGAETFSRIINWEDRGTCVLFGDGAGAAVVGPVPEGLGVLSFYLGSDGEGGKWLYQPAGGSRLPASAETVAGRMHTIHMHGNEVFKYAVRVMEEASLTALSRCGLTPREVDFFVPHQANIRIVEAARKRLDIPPEKAFLNIHRCGNISSASIPLALDEASKAGRMHFGDTVLLAAFGAGFTWGAAVLKWAK
ncbi:MAG: ketoacyl-ACP synthase III [Clostridia bacterium]|nr:MAG: ketoacyl-ACP synthase III [Clostridia bacterium]